MKKVLAVCLAAVICLALLPMTAAANNGLWEIGDDGYHTYNGKDDTIPSDGNFVIPNGVTIINRIWFTNFSYNLHQNGTIQRVTLPNSLTSIGSDAFANWGITSINIPDSVTSIGGQAFAWSAITSITIPNKVQSIERMTFYFCQNLTNVTIGNGVKSIDLGAFSTCFSLKSINIPDSVTIIEDGAFRQCTSLESVTIGNGVKSIGIGAFDDCDLRSVTIPDSVTSLGLSAFCNNQNLTTVVIGNGVTKIDNAVFSGCTNLTSVTIPESVTDIDGSAFNRNTIFTIYGKAGSFAETYAKSTNRPFVAIGGTTPTDPPPTGNAPNLDSATDAAWARDSINQAYQANLIPPALQSSYKQATTRAEFAALAVTLYEQVTGTTITERITFNDTTDINVEKAAAIGVVNGVGNNNFSPDTGLTREQAATMLSRLANAIGKPLTKQAAAFNDNSSISSWALDAVGQVQAAEIMGGVGNNTFAPQGDYTREQSITTIMRLYNIVK